MVQSERATLLPIKASCVRAYLGKKESKRLKKEIEKALAEGRKVEI